jgi:hypothetical protein
MRWNRDNLAGIKFNRPWKWLLLPGVILLWLEFMIPSKKIIVSARRARSPLMTTVYSIAFYAVGLFILVSVITAR